MTGGANGTGQVGPGYVEPAAKKAKKEGSEKARGDGDGLGVLDRGIGRRSQRMLQPLSQ